MGVARDAVFILTDEDGVVILSVLEFLTALIQQSSPDKGIDHVPVQESVLEQVGVHPPHLLTGRGQGKFLSGLFLLLLGGSVDDSLFPAQQTGDGLWVGEVIELLDEGDGAAALLHSVVVPSIAPDGDAVVAGQTVLRPGADQLLPLMAEELHQIHLAGPELLLLGKMDIGHLLHLFSLLCMFT